MSKEHDILSGSLGVSPEKVTIAWLNTEVINKAKQGDDYSVYRLQQIARHSEDSAIKAYAVSVLATFNQHPLESIALVGASTVAVAGTITLAVDYLPSDVTDTRAATFATSDAAKATVSEAGVVTGVGAGTVTITATATADTSIKATKVITVTAE